MSQVTLQGPLIGAGPTAAAPNGVPGVIADPPPAVTQLPNGHLLQGEVVGRNEQGQTLVRTDLGTLAVATRAQLPQGSQVTLQIRTSGAQLQIAVLQVDGHPPQFRGGGPAPAPPPGTPPGAASTAPAGSPVRQTVPQGATPAAAAQPAPMSGQAPGQPAAQAAGAATGLPGTIDHPPASIANLPTGALLEGAVLGRDSAGRFLVRTEFGTLPLTTEVRLASGNRVTLRVTSVVPQVQVQVVPGEAAAKGVARAAAGAPARPSGAASTGVAGGPLPGRTTSASVLAASQAAAPGASAAASAVASRAAGGPHLASAQDVLTVGQAVRAVVSSPTGPPPAGPSPALGLPGTATAPTPEPRILPPGAALPAGSALQVRVAQVSPPEPSVSGAPAAAVAPGQAAAGTASGPAGAAAAEAAAAAPPQAAPGDVLLEGLVTGTTPTGQPQVQTAAGLLTLQIKAELPPGTRLVLTLPAQQLLAQALEGAPPPAAEPISLAYGWPALQSAIDALQTLDDGVGRAVLSAQATATPLPQPGPRLSSAMLFFVSALSGGSPAAWLGELAAGQVARRLEHAGHGELLSRLRSDLGAMSRLGEAGGESWRLLPIPLYNGGQVQQMRLFLRRREGRRTRQDEGAEATRFVLEVSLTRLGELQLDGLVRPKRFDLILRSRQALPPAMRQDISEIFEAANAATGFEGSLTFHDSPDWQAMPIGAAATGLVV